MEAKILVIEDDRITMEMLRRSLEKTGYEVACAGDGLKGIELALSVRPDLVLLDIMLPGISGLEVCRILRQNWLMFSVPIVMLTTLSSLNEKLKGISSGADDYLTKPIALPELQARVMMHLQRSRRERDLNPLTGFPGNREIEAEIQRRLAKEEVFGLAYIDLDNFKPYNDQYGFHMGDRVLLALALLLREAASDYGTLARNFIGHIGGDDFVLATDKDRLAEISAHIAKGFKSLVPSFYPSEVVERDYMDGVSREGVPHRFKLCAVSIGGLIVWPSRWPDGPTLIRYLMQLKNKAKRSADNLYLEES
jgi:PleD family two-component response regulator